MDGDGAFRWLFDPYGLGSSGRIVSDGLARSHFGMILDIQPMFVLLFKSGGRCRHGERERTIAAKMAVFLAV